MKPLVPGQTYHGRIADLRFADPLSSDRPTRSVRLTLYVGDALRVFAVPAPLASRLRGLRHGVLVRFAVDGAGMLADLAVLGAALASEPGSGPRSEPAPAGDALRWRRPARSGPSRMALLALRHRILRAVRDWLDGQGFLEAETPALVRAPSPEAVFAPLAAGEGYLITSPEFQLKRMLVGGFERVYRLGPVFRGGEVGAHHNPEFTLLEWYRVSGDAPAMATLADDLEGLLGALVPCAEEAASLWEEEATRARLRRLATDLRALPWRQATVRALFAETLGLEIGGVTTPAGLHAAARAAGLPGAEAEALPVDFTGAFSALWLRVEAALDAAPLLVTEWPALTASLARLKPDDPTVAERMELYVGGLELANGFAELTDPAEQRRRFEADLAERARLGLPPLPLDEAFLAALAEGMPPAAGMALGIDRLVLLLTGAREIRDVLPFAWDER